METKKHLKIILIIVFVFLTFLFVVYLKYQYSLKSQQKLQILKLQNENNYNINLLIDFGDGNKQEINNITVKQSDNLLLVIQELSKTTIKNIETQNYGNMGVLLTSINNYKNGTDNKYWQYYINGEQPMISMDKYILSNNDFIELKFIKSQF